MKPFDITLLGKKYSCKPTFETIQAIENSTGKGTFQLANEIVSAQYKMSEFILVISCMIGRQAKGVTVEQLSEEVIGNIGKFSEAVVGYLLSCNQGSEELESDQVGGSEGKD